jgi:mono/diheme cytochrome c family protein
MKAHIVHKWAALLLVVITVLSVAGCRTSRRGEPFRADPPPQTDNFALGQKVFYQHCHYCHPGGEGGLGPALFDKPLPGFLMKTQVRVGLGAMPHFDKEQINAEELAALIDYIKTMRRVPVDKAELTAR